MALRKTVTRKFIVIAACLLAVSLVYWNHRPLPHFRIGYISSLSGSQAALAVAARDGAMLAVEQINAKGGVNRQLIELAVMDDAGDPNESRKLIEELHRQKIQIVIGPFTSAAAAAVLPYANKHGILVIGPVAAADDLHDKEDMFLTLYPKVSRFGARLAQLAISQKVRRVAIIGDTRNSNYLSSFSNAAGAVFKKNDACNLVGHVYYDGKIKNLSVVAKKVVKLKPDGVLLVSSALDASILAQKLKTQIPDLKLYTSSWGVAKELITHGGHAVQGIQAYVPFLYGCSLPRYRAFADEYEARYSGQPDYTSVFNYEAVMILAQALKRSPNRDPHAIKEILLTAGPHTGLQTTITLNKYGDAERALYHTTVMSDKFMNIHR